MDPHWSDDDLVARIAGFLEQVESSGDVEMQISDVLAGLSALKAGSTPGMDKVTTEMVKNLPTEVVYKIGDFFRARFSGGVGEPVQEWCRAVVFFLAKCSRANSMQQLRGISLTSVILKWYSCSILHLFWDRDGPHKHIHRDICIFGFTPGMACTQITETIRVLLSKSFEWPEHIPVHIIVGDVHKTFDFMHPSIVSEALRACRLPPRLAAALLREGRSMENW
eukprot:2268637-Pyramimonas_sp.AAC.1